MHKSEIRVYLEDASRSGATHLLIVCDTFKYEDFPVYVMPGMDVLKIVAEYSDKSMSQVLEVYALHVNWEEQLKEHRSRHYEYPKKLGLNFAKRSPPKLRLIQGGKAS